MKIGSMSSMTSGFSIMSLSVLLVVSFSTEALAKRGCSAFGHSCFGGHGKRSNSDGPKQSLEVNGVSLNNELSDSSNDIRKLTMSSEDFRQLQDFVHRRNRAIALSRCPRANYVPIFIGKWLTSHRRPYNAHSDTDDK